MPARRFAVIPQGGGTVPQTAIPTFSPLAGSYSGPQLVSISTTTLGATIYFTIGATTPTTASPVYSGPITVPSTETINAVAITNGYTLSPVASALYTIASPQAATPTFSPTAGNYSGSQSVTISCSTPSSSIYYTTNGTTPTTGSTPYTAPITVSSAETVQAIATAGGFTQSAVGSAAYTFVAPTGLIKFIPGDMIGSATVYGTTPAQAVADLQAHVAAVAAAGKNVMGGYMAGFRWPHLETSTVSTSPTYNFSDVWCIHNLVKAYMGDTFGYGTYVTGNDYNHGLTQAQITSTNFANPVGFYIPTYILNCGGSMTVPNSFGSGSTTVYPVAPCYPGASNYGVIFESYGGDTSPASNEKMGSVIPAWHNPGIVQCFQNFMQALDASVCPTPTVWAAGTTYTPGLQVTNGGNTYTYINAANTAGNLVSNTTFWRQTNQTFVGLTLDQNPYVFAKATNDEVSYNFAVSQNFSTGITINPPNSVAGHPETIANNTNFWIQRVKWLSAVTGFAPHTPFGLCDSFTWDVGGGLSQDSNINMAANINEFITASNRSAPVALSTITGLAFSQADTYGFDFSATNNAASWGKQGYIGIATPGTGGALPTATFPSLGGQMPYIAQIQPNDYSVGVSGPGQNASAVQQVMQSSSLRGQYRIWCLTDKTGGTGPWGSYIYAAIVANQAAYPVSTQRPTKIMPPITINSVTVASATSLTIQYTPYVLNPAETNTRYAIYRDGTFIATDISGSYTDTGLTTGVTHVYTMGMSNSNGQGPVGAGVSGTPSGAVQVFNFANFAGAPATINLVNVAAYSGNQINITNGVSHNGGCAWYKTLQNIQSFTTTFNFLLPAGTPSSNNYGFVFVIQNCNSTTNPFASGVNTVPSSANGIGYGAGGGSGQPSVANSIGLVFNTSAFNQTGWYVSPTPWSAIALCVDGGPAIGGGAPFGSTNGSGFAPLIDAHSLGLNVGSGNPISCVVTYDGTTLVLVATDTVSLATTRLSWPVNIPAIVGANTAFVGFMANSASDTGVDTQVKSWAYSTGYNTRLATPTFSVPAGQYTGTQTVALSGPVGASIYYTTNGTPPTTASTLYTSAITVSATQAIHAVAVQANFTDSFVAEALYLIQATATPVINFPSGFASAGGLVRTLGQSTISAGNIALVDNANTFEAGASWFDVQVPISTFSTTFTINLSSINTSFANGLCFVLQNYPQTNTGTNLNWNLGNGPFGVTVVSGGPYTLGSPGSGTQAAAFGYVQIFNSIGVVFDISTNTVGLYTNGAFPSGSQVAIGGSVSLASTTAISVTIAYNGTALTLSMHQGANTFNLTLSASINIPTIVGASSAWAGFTAATNFGSSNIQISNWTM